MPKHRRKNLVLILEAISEEKEVNERDNRRNKRPSEGGENMMTKRLKLSEAPSLRSQTN